MKTLFMLSLICLVFTGCSPKPDNYYSALQMNQTNQILEKKSLMKNDNYFPDSWIEGYDKSFSVQKFFRSKKSFLADTETDGYRVSHWVEKYCKKYDINQRAVIASIQYEHSILSGYVKGKYFYYGWNRPPRELKRLLGMICGISGGSVRRSVKYRGLQRQLRMCPELLRRDITDGQTMVGKKMLVELPSGKKKDDYDSNNNPKVAIYPKSASAFALFKYSPKKYKVRTFKEVWLSLFPEYKEKVR